MRFRILGSSSAGNSALICTEKCNVLLDAGFTGKRMEALLEQAGVALEQIDAIFITHEHSDHVTGLRGLTRKCPDIRVFANATTSRIVQERLPRQLNWQIFENGLPFVFADLTVSPFSIPHDAYDPVGYHFRQREQSDGTDAGSDGAATSNAANTAVNSVNTSAGRSVCWLTDLGYVTAAARRHATECDLLVVEANHDPDMLEHCETRSWSTKQRIRGRHGHLSNEAAYDLLATIENPRWKHVCLAHISTECNSLQIVEKQFAPLRNGTRNLDIHIFDPASPAPGAEFDLRERPTAQPAMEPAAQLEEPQPTITIATAQSTTVPEPSAATASTRLQGEKAASVRITRATQIEITLNF